MRSPMQLVHRHARRTMGTQSQAALPGWFKRMQATNEYNLPRLPVPQLAETLQRYLETVRPLVSEKEWQDHADLVAKFEATEGRQLQEHLLKRELSQAMSKSYPFSYIEADWDKMYLAGRYENPINVNPSYGLRDETEANLKGQVPRTAAMVRSMVKWWDKVKSSELEQDPQQCMFSFARQFGTARVPKLGRDVLESYPRSNHIVVMKGNQFYQLDVLSPDGKHLLSQSMLEQRLNEILNSSHKPDHDDVDLSMLTAQNRDTWAQIREDLIAHHPVNEQSLHVIDSALFMLVLDDRAPTDTVKRMELQLHGDASRRWFDKVQVIVHGDGHMGVNFEHSFSDGTSWNRWIHEAWHDMRGTSSGFAPLKELPEYTDSTKPTLLSWKLSNNLVEEVKKAEAHFEQFAGNVKADYLEYTNFAKKDCKRWKLSPDGIAQMAFQLAFYRAHGQPSAVYESCSTRGFLHGRTETIRSATPAAAEFVKAVTSGSADKSEQRDLMVKAVNRHVEMAKMAQKGLGCDRHLTALASIANDIGIKSEFLTSPVRAASANFQICTSNVTQPFLEYFTFGAVVPHGYGIGYLLHNDTFNVTLTNFKDSGFSDSTTYKHAISDALDTIKDLADAAP